MLFSDLCVGKPGLEVGKQLQRGWMGNMNPGHTASKERHSFP